MKVRAQINDKYEGLPPLFPFRSDYWYVPQSTHEEIFILGGGASFKRAYAERLRDRFVIGCNEAFRLGSDLIDWCHFTDLAWWLQHKDELQSYDGTLTTVQRLVDDPRVRVFKGKPSGIEFQNRCRVGVNRNTGLGAINIAVHLGATRIVLLGFDMSEAAEDHHWYERDDKGDRHSTYRMHRRFALDVWEDLRRKGGIEVVNACPDSGLPFWPKVELEEVLG